MKSIINSDIVKLRTVIIVPILLHNIIALLNFEY